MVEKKKKKKKETAPEAETAPPDPRGGGVTSPEPISQATKRGGQKKSIAFGKGRKIRKPPDPSSERSGGNIVRRKSPFEKELENFRDGETSTTRGEQTNQKKDLPSDPFGIAGPGREGCPEQDRRKTTGPRANYTKRGSGKGKKIRSLLSRKWDRKKRKVCIKRKS